MSRLLYLVALALQQQNRMLTGTAGELAMDVHSMDIRDFQRLIEKMYSHKDRQRGSAGTFLWLTEEIGELAAAIAGNQTKEQKAAEFADVLAWLVTLANVEGIDLSEALHAKYGQGCPGCGLMVCKCNKKA